ncbi:MAG: T9SS type A sorting domain-containing protein, partial [Bacteroidetes bacterium]|nr:T9SS type A sorting domain-containing protein [Bacteroidota bacterium]
MPRNLSLIAGLLLLACLQGRALRGQCLVAPPAPVCTGAGPVAVEGETLTTGNTKWLYGGPTTITNYTLDGGTLIVCGNLTIDKLIFNTGTIYICPGGNFVIGSGIGTTLQLMGGCYIYNYGSMTVLRNLALDNGHVSPANPNVLINATSSSSLSIPFTWFVINNPYSWFVNNGKTTAAGIITDPAAAPGCVCLGDKSITQQNQLLNKALNPYLTPSGVSCMSVSSYSSICDRVASGMGTSICLSSSFSADSSCLLSAGKHNAWGTAYVMKNCATCVGLTLLEVDTARSKNNLTPQRQAAGVASSVILYPNPFVRSIDIDLPDGGAGVNIIITNMQGQQIRPSSVTRKSDRVLQIDFGAALPAGHYAIQINSGKVVSVHKL